MGYFSYHNKIQSKIKKGELETFEFLDEYHNISPVLVLHFKDGTSFPIREHMFEEYFKLLQIDKVVIK